MRARVEGHLLVGASEGMLARLQRGIEHLELGIDAYEIAPRTVQRFEAGNDPGVVCHLVDGMLLWMKGFPDQAHQRAYEAIRLSERLGQPHSSAYAHFHTGLIHIWLSEADRAAEHAQAVIDLANAYDFPVWDAVASCLYGAAIAATGAVEEGAARFEAAIDQYRGLTTPPVFYPALLHLYAIVLGLAQRPDEGIAQLDEAFEVLTSVPEPQMLASESLALRGSLELALSNDAEQAEVWFQRAIDNADQLEAPMLQLRATMPRAQLWCAQGRVAPARALLASAYERFTEGFTTFDLTAARALLDEWSVAD